MIIFNVPFRRLSCLFKCADNCIHYYTASLSFLLLPQNAIYHISFYKCYDCLSIKFNILFVIIKVHLHTRTTHMQYIYAPQFLLIYFRKANIYFIGGTNDNVFIVIIPKAQSSNSSLIQKILYNGYI